VDNPKQKAIRENRMAVGFCAQMMILWDQRNWTIQPSLAGFPQEASGIQRPVSLLCKTDKNSLDRRLPIGFLAWWIREVKMV